MFVDDIDYLKKAMSSFIHVYHTTYFTSESSRL